MWNRDGTKLVTASADGTARLYDAATGAEEAVLSGHAGEWIAAVWCRRWLAGRDRLEQQRADLGRIDRVRMAPVARRAAR